MNKKSKAGRPTKYKRKYCQLFVERSKKGLSLAQIAAEWDVARDTLYEWRDKHPEFSDAIKRGRELCEAWYINLGQTAMVGRAVLDGRPIQFQLGVFVWLTKNLFKWSDKMETKSAGGPDLSRPLQDLTDEELDKL